MGNNVTKKQIKTLNNLQKENVLELVKGRDVIARVIDCYDGDTCTIVFLVGEVPISLQLRLLGIDTAEKSRRQDRSDRTSEEIELCEAALAFLSSRVLNKCVYVEMSMWGKYGGRVLGNLYCIDKKGQKTGASLSQQLLDAGLAVEYHGKKKDTNWAKVYWEWKS